METLITKTSISRLLLCDPQPRPLAISLQLPILQSVRTNKELFLAPVVEELKVKQADKGANSNGSSTAKRRSPNWPQSHGSKMEHPSRLPVSANRWHSTPAR